MAKTDARVQTVTETISILRMIKLFAWERNIEERLEKKRDEEMHQVKRRKWIEVLNDNITYLLPLLTMLVTFGTYTVVMKQQLTASKVFSAISVFLGLERYLGMSAFMLPRCIQAKVSIDRIDAFLYETELLDSFAQSQDAELARVNVVPDADHQAIGFHNATFSWANDTDGTQTPGRRRFQLRIEGDLLFQRDKINLIVGPTGSGKTSLLMALLGELHFHPSGSDSWFNLPREEGVAYCAQEAWIQNETIKNNILFGNPFDEERYKKVIFQCALEQDLELFEAGDQTEVGEKGLTLSGGQKARVALARAIYSNANILILDDVLSALDVHTTRWVADKCLGGELVQGRTVLLVTHNIAVASTVVHWVVSLGLDGRIVNQAPINEALQQDSILLAEIAKDNDRVEHAEEILATEKVETTGKPTGKLVKAEEIAVGHVRWPAVKLFLSSMGGPIFWITILLTLVLTTAGGISRTWYLGYWARQYEPPIHEVSAPRYLAGYGTILFVEVIIYTTAYVTFTLGSIRASKRIHAKLAGSVLRSTLRWLDLTPAGRMISRFTQDMEVVDGPFTSGVYQFIFLTSNLLQSFMVVVLYSPGFALPGLLIAVAAGWIGQIYIASQLSVKREMSNTRSPLYSHFGASIAGITSIRAFGVQNAFIKESMRRIDRYTLPARTNYDLNRWMSFRMDVLGGLYSATLATYLIYFRSVDASNTGFQLNMAVMFSSLIMWWVRFLNEIEVQGNSLERIQDYLTIEHEPQPVEGGTPPAHWPTSGRLHIEDLRARYSSDGPEVLHGLSFSINSGERVGVVGRTGSGKSSLTLSLLRMIPTSGTVYFDGIPTSSLNLDALRSNITIIPQQPELLSGTLRQNLDPFDQYDDAELNNALRSAGLFNVQAEDEEGRITLDTSVSSGGSNFSVGQRQIIALARALVRRSKVLILDEATAAIDYETDTLIQNTIRTELNDVTLIVVAHRLQTIMDTDKILVLDAGNIVEFDSPWALLNKEGGAFKTMVDDSGDQERLYAIAKSAAK